MHRLTVAGSPQTSARGWLCRVASGFAVTAQGTHRVSVAQSARIAQEPLVPSVGWMPPVWQCSCPPGCVTQGSKGAPRMRSMKYMIGNRPMSAYVALSAINSDKSIHD